MDKKLVSIIIPCYNHVQYVEDCLNSVMAQTYERIELIIIDDCSSDESYLKICDMVQQLKRRCENVICEKNIENLKISKTVNKGISMSGGDYIKLLASDDMLHPKCIEKLVEKMKSDVCIDMLFSNGYYMTEDSTFSSITHGKKNKSECFYEGNPLCDAEQIFVKLYKGNFIIGGTVFYRKSSILQFGLYDETIAVEDWDNNLRFALKGKIGYVEEKIFYYRDNPLSISNTHKDEKAFERYDYMLNATLQVLEKYKDEVERTVYRWKKRDIIAGYIEKAMLIRYHEKVKELNQYLSDSNLGYTKKDKIKYICYLLHIVKIYFVIRRKLNR